MGNELEVVQTQSTSVFANDAEYASGTQIAKMLASSEIVPDTYRNKPANCLIALDYARQVKTSPLIVMQNLYIVKGKPSWSGTYIAGVIRAKYRNVVLEMGGEGDDYGCRVIAEDENGNKLVGAKVTYAMAKAEGWWNNIDKYGKERSKWQSMPELMLQYRASAFFGRVYCPEKLLGIMSEFEAMDIVGSNEPVAKGEIKSAFVMKQPEAKPEQPVIEAEVVEDLTIELPVERFYEEGEPQPEEEEQASLLKCSGCGKFVSDKVFQYSNDTFGKTLCYTCQKANG